MSTNSPLRSFQVEREDRIRARECTMTDVEKLLYEALASHAGTAIERHALSAFEFARRLDYSHPGMSIAGYLAHPVRVASLVLRVLRPVDELAVVLALTHNVFELSSVEPGEISKRFGQPIADAIAALTVDRSQKTREYTASYYRRLAHLPSYVRVIKVLDKLDNLFVLCLNPDETVRRDYLADIETFLLPIVAADLPMLLPYVTALVEDTRAIGHRPFG
jgi:(p)ppGpp synthase/HD superfamily hydrolase